MSRTLVMIKPDGLEKNLIGQIIDRFERNEFKVVNARILTPTRELCEAHYEEHSYDESFFNMVVDALCAGAVMPMVLEGKKAVKRSRALIGPPLFAPEGTIRGDFGVNEPFNVIHGADSKEAAAREIELWFD